MDPTGKNVRIWHFGIATVVALVEKSSPSHAVQLPTSKNTCGESTSARNMPLNHEPNQPFLARIRHQDYSTFSQIHAREGKSQTSPNSNTPLTLWTCVTRQALIIVEQLLCCEMISHLSKEAVELIPKSGNTIRSRIIDEFRYRKVKLIGVFQESL
jgi:hypothetical protein